LSSSYYSGQTDLWPAFGLLLSAYLLLVKRNFFVAGLSLGIAIGFKYGVMLVIPFIIVFMFDNPRYKKSFSKLLSATALTVTVSYLPAVFSSDFRELILWGNTEKDILALSIDLSGFKLYLVPATYLLLLVWIYRAGRTTAQVLVVFLSVAVISIATLTPASFGWVLWAFPTLLAFLSFTDRKLFWILGVFQVVYFIAKSEVVKAKITDDSEWFYSTINSILLIFSAVLMVRILQHGVKQGDVYRLASQPFSIAIAGDSGVGKDTLANSISNAFGKEAATVICGDNYHLYERGDYVWGSHTHLNPKMNDLRLWALDLNEAAHRNSLQSKEYDHAVGRFLSIGIDQKSDLLISQGLHANYRELSRDLDATIFIEMEDELRLHLKMQRDTSQRNQSKEQILKQLHSRKSDYERYITTQKATSDVCLRFISNNELTVRLVEITTINLPGFHQELLNTFITFFPETIMKDSQEFDSLTLDSFFIEKSSIESALRKNLLSYDQFFPVEPIVGDGTKGLMQLVSFMLIDYKRKNNLVNK
jgi:uridine kinase